MRRICCFVLFLMGFIFYGQGTDPVVESKTGVASFKNQNASIIVFLVNNLDETLEIWSKPDSEGFPKIKTTANAYVNNGIAPFIVYSLSNDAKTPLYYDMKLMKPNGDYSTNAAVKLPLATKKPLNNMLYTAEQFYGWGFDDSDQKGTYSISIRIYNDIETIIEYKMLFSLE